MTARSISARRAALATLTAALIFPLSGPAYAAGRTTTATLKGAPPSVITIDVLTVNGSGCPAGTATIKVQPDNTGFKINYKDFVATDGGNSRNTDFRKNCQVNLLVHVPQGFTFAIAEADYRGRAKLEAGATALERTNYYFMGDSDDNYRDHSFAGPLTGSWHAEDVTAVVDLVYSPCGEDVNLNVNTELRVHAPDGTNKVNYIAMKSSEGDVDTLFNFHWLSC